ncbi:MAG TPA: FG-GAP-like repeat-containing protein [Saprospiraceae bacterium]|nr:FG-GAP-like repeat-containing protein [Saprospiraceae bacterium]
MHKIITTSIFLLIFPFSSRLFSQPVTFTQTTELLNPITGFSSYSDCVVDMNADYLDDVVRVGGKGVFIDYQQKNGTFLQKQFNFPVQSPPSWSICAGDLDDNGFNDLLFAGSASVSFILANDDGTDYTETLMPVSVESQRSTMADINNDGRLDAFVCHESAQSVPFRNMGNGNMIPDTNLIHTANRKGNYAAIWTDFDNDGDIDLYLTKCLQGALPGDIVRTNLLYRNNSDGTFTEVGAAAGVDDNAQSWSTVFEDFDNDGDFDAFVVNHDFANRLYRNNGDGTFTDVIQASGIHPFDLNAFENSSGDFNNDGYIDIFSELTFKFHLGNGDLTFTPQEGPVKPGAIGDLNDDGFLDVMHDNKVWLNDGNENHWVKFNLQGIQSNRNGIGARIEIYGSWGKQIREVRSGQSYSPMSSLTTHFGMGESDKIDSVIVRWPSGIITHWTDLTSDNTYLIPETSCFHGPVTLNYTGTILWCPGEPFELRGPPGFVDYFWPNGSSSQSTTFNTEGIYCLTVTDNIGCTSISNCVEVKWIEEQIPVISISDGIRFCEGDSITLTSSPAQTYLWSTGETTQQIKVGESGDYTVAVNSECSTENLISEVRNIIVVESPSPNVSDVFVYPGDSILLMAEGENIYWYDQPVGGILLGTGSSLQTSSLGTTTTYYVESHHPYPGVIQSGGKTDTTGTGGLPLQNGHLLFETWKPFTLMSVAVYIPLGGPQGVRFIELYSNDTLVASKQFTVHTGMNILNLDFDIPVGKHYLTCPQGNLFRNTGSLNYPYPIGDAGEIYNSSNGENYYYYFYDWKIREPDIECFSDRIPVNVIVSGNINLEDDDVVKIYPNPSSGNFFIEFTGNTIPKDISIIDLFGREVLNKLTMDNSIVQMKPENCTPGVCFLRFSKDGKRTVKRIILYP